MKFLFKIINDILKVNLKNLSGYVFKYLNFRSIEVKNEFLLISLFDYIWFIINWFKSFEEIKGKLK